MHVLVSGGAGYIGSFAVRELIRQGHLVTVIDDLSTGFLQAVDPKAELCVGNLLDGLFVQQVFQKRPIDQVMHFAARVSVPESIFQPLKYYENNLLGGIHLLRACQKFAVSKFVFSSTAAVYGVLGPTAPLNEFSTTLPTNPYGTSKLFFEKILLDAQKAWGLNTVILRYFNVAGASLDLQLGQRTANATHLIKVAAETAAGKRPEMEIFGTDYPTPDGSAVRDYIHVEDLVSAHLQALTFLEEHQNHKGMTEIFNCGYGRGHSVLEVVAMMEKVSQQKLKVHNKPRRVGDVSLVVADNQKIKMQFNWVPKLDDLATICKTAYLWEKKSQV